MEFAKDKVIVTAKLGKEMLDKFKALPKEVTEKLGVNDKGEMKMEGTYKFLDKDTIEVSMKEPGEGEAKAEKSKVEVTKDSLSITDLEGENKDKTKKLKRAKT